MYIPYSGYISKVVKEKTDMGIVYEKEIDGYNFKVSPTPYLGYDAFLSVSQNHNVYLDTEGNIISFDKSITLFIWPNIWTGNEYGIMFLNEINDTFIQVMIDENGNYLPYNINDEDFNREVETYISENENEIFKLIGLAKNMWGLNFVDDMKSGIHSCAKDEITLLCVFLIFTIIFITFNLFRWYFRIRIPFLQYTNEMISYVNPKDKIFKKANFKKSTNNYIFYAKLPAFGMNNGALITCKNDCEIKNTECLVKVLIYPQKKNTVQVCVGKQKISTLELNMNYRENLKDLFITDTQKEEIIELIGAAKDFWSI